MNHYIFTPVVSHDDLIEEINGGEGYDLSCQETIVGDIYTLENGGLQLKVYDLVAQTGRLGYEFSIKVPGSTWLRVGGDVINTDSSFTAANECRVKVQALLRMIAGIE